MKQIRNTTRGIQTSLRDWTMRGSNPRRGDVGFSSPSVQKTSGAHAAHFSIRTGDKSAGGWGVKMNTHHLLVQRIRRNGVLSLLPPDAIKTCRNTSLFCILIYDKNTSNAHLTIGMLIGIWGKTVQQLRRLCCVLGSHQLYFHRNLQKFREKILFS